MDDCVKKYRNRRAARLNERGYRLDEEDDDGQWFTTKNGHRVHVTDDGDIDKGNPYMLKAIGKPIVDESSVTKALGSAKTEKTIGDALKKAGYKAKNMSDEYGYTNFHIEKENGGYVRIYVDGKGRRATVKVQEWNPAPKEKLRPDKEIEDAKKRVTAASKKWADASKKLPEFSSLSNEDKWNFIAAKTAQFHLGNGMDSKTAWSRAIDNANHYKSIGYGEYEKTMSLKEHDYWGA